MVVVILVKRSERLVEGESESAIVSWILAGRFWGDNLWFVGQGAVEVTGGDAVPMSPSNLNPETRVDAMQSKTKRKEERGKKTQYQFQGKQITPGPPFET
jgi:hypothetical protein